MKPKAFLRPDLVSPHGSRKISKSDSPRACAEALLNGTSLHLRCDYRKGAAILSAVEKLSPPPWESDFATRTEHQRQQRTAQMRLTAPIQGHRVSLDNARPIGFLKELYPESKDFTLPFPEVQALHGAWRAYKEGSHLAVLGHKVHPFYGTYVPRRTSHLELFGTWLSGYKGRRRSAVDVGTGCGVLALMMNKAGFQNVTATDCNPNALESLRRDLKRQNLGQNFSLLQTDLIEAAPSGADVLVFNPPWIQGQVQSFLDRALTFDDDLFERFFQQATSKLAPNGRLVLIFSNILQLLQPEVEHPILAELEKNRFHLVNKMQRRVKSDSNRSSPRRRTKERVEIWELALR